MNFFCYKVVKYISSRVIVIKDGVIISDERREEISPSAENARESRFEMHDAKNGSLWNDGRFIGFMAQAFQSILANKMRSFLSVLGILVGVAYLRNKNVLHIRNIRMLDITIRLIIQLTGIG